jgi:hypothetical protein
MKFRLAALASALGFHKPRAREDYGAWDSSCLRASSARHEQGGSLASSWRESDRDNGHSPPNRRPAVVGLAAPPYGLPSTDPTTRPSAGVTPCVTPVPSLAIALSADGLGRHVPLAPTVLTAKRGWSAPADNRHGSEFPLDPLPSRGDGRLLRPERVPTDHLVFAPLILASPALSGPWRYQ